MDTSRLSRRNILKSAGVVAALGVVGGAGAGRANAESDDDETAVRWDLISVNFGTGTASAGGVASARANDNSRIKLTGSGTFVPGHRHKVTGGGTFTTFAPATPPAVGAGTGSGTYTVKELVDWHEAPGTFPLPHDAIGNRADARAGLAVLRVRYSNGRDGILVVSCDLVGTPDSVFEGITASTGFVDYWNREAPTGENRTLFHVVPEHDEDD